MSRLRQRNLKLEEDLRNFADQQQPDRAAASFYSKGLSAMTPAPKTPDSQIGRDRETIRQ